MNDFAASSSRRRKPAPRIVQDAGSLHEALISQLSSLNTAIGDVSKKLDHVAEGQADLRVSAERREAAQVVLTEKVDRHIEDTRNQIKVEADIHAAHAARLASLEAYLPGLKAVKRLGSIVSTAVGLALTGTILAGCAWAVKKMTGWEISHYLHFGE